MDCTEDQYITNMDYVPNNCSEVIFKMEQQSLKTKDPPEEEEYSILDISKSEEPYYYVHPEQTSEFQEEPQDEVEYEDSDDCDDEDRGVLKHAWQDEDPNNEFDSEQGPDSDLKVALSNIVKFINFLNKLQEDHRTFVNSDITNMQVIEQQKQAVVINAFMINELVKMNFDSNNSHVNEIVNELKKILSIKVELYDKLYDKQVNGVVPHDVIKRLFSGNYLLTKSQIDELRGILFKKLENVHKTLAKKQGELWKLKQASRKKPLQKFQVFARPVPAQNNYVDKKIRDAKRKNNNLHTMTQEISSSLQNIQHKKSRIKARIESLKEGDWPRDVKSKNVDLCTVEQRMNKKTKIKSQIENLFEDAMPSLAGLSVESNNGSFNFLKRKSPTSKEKSSLEDFDSFTQVISKKLKLKPEEASPSLILSKFRTNLNKKLNGISKDKSEMTDDQVENQPSFTELDLEDYREEEALVEEVFFEDFHSEDIEDRVIKSLSGRWCGDTIGTLDENSGYKEIAVTEENHDSSYIIQDLTNSKPPPEENEVMSYVINDVTFTKLPSTPHQHVWPQPDQTVYEHLILSKDDLENPVQNPREKPVYIDLASADIEKSLLKDREKAMWQLEHMVLDQASKNNTIWNKFIRQLNKSDDVIVTTGNRKLVQEHLEKRLKELEDKAELAKKSLLLLNKTKRKTNKELGNLYEKDTLRKSSKSFINKNYEGKPYFLQKSNVNPSQYITIKVTSGKPYVPQKHKNVKAFVQNNSTNSNLLESPEINNKLKALFKNNNLKGKLMKMKIINQGKEVTNNNMKPNSDGEIEIVPNGTFETSNDNDASTNRFKTLPNPKTNSEVVLDRQKMIDSNRKVNATMNNGCNKNGVKGAKKNNNAVEVKAHEVTLPRNNVYEGKKSIKTLVPRSFAITTNKKSLPLTLLGDSSKLLLRKAPPLVTVTKDSRDFLRNKIKTKRKKSTEGEEHTNNADLLKNKIKTRRKSSEMREFENSDSNSKKLLEKLKLQIFEKLHRQDNAKKSAEIKQEIEKRLRRKEKLKTWQKLSK